MSEGISKVSLVNPAPLPSRKQVVQILAKQVGLLDEGLALVDVNIDVPSGIPIDMLARDRRGAAYIIDVFDGKDSSWLVHLLHHVKFIEESSRSFANRYEEFSGGKPPAIRAAAVVARLTTPSVQALSYFKDLPIECFSVRCFSDGDGKFLALEKRKATPLSATKLRSKAEEMNVESKQERIKPVELTEDEIADFLGQEVRGREEKERHRRTQSPANQSFI